jgi:hypothetical protein
VRKRSEIGASWMSADLLALFIRREEGSGIGREWVGRRSGDVSCVKRRRSFLAHAEGGMGGTASGCAEESVRREPTALLLAESSCA